MTAERVRSLQAARQTPGVQMVPCTIVTDSPLTVELPGGATVAGRAIPGLTYVVGEPAYAMVQEPAVGPIIPIT